MVFYQYTLSVVELENKELISRILNTISDIKSSNEDFMEIFAYSIYDYSRKDYGKRFELIGDGFWSQWDKQMRELTQKVPNVLFKLRRETVDEEDGNDVCTYYFLNGQLEFHTY